MKEEDVALKVLDIKKLVNMLSDEKVVELNEDLYWNILDEELYDPYETPMDFTMGSLSEDWLFLQRIVKKERDMIDYDLYKLASILRFLGKKNILAKEE